MQRLTMHTRLSDQRHQLKATVVALLFKQKGSITAVIFSFNLMSAPEIKICGIMGYAIFASNSWLVL